METSQNAFLIKRAMYELFCDGWPVGILSRIFDQNDVYVEEGIRESLQEERKARREVKT